MELTPDGLVKQATEFAREWDQLLNGDPPSDADFQGMANWPKEMAQDVGERARQFTCFVIHYLFPNLEEARFGEVKRLALARLKLRAAVVSFSGVVDEVEKAKSEHEFMWAAAVVRTWVEEVSPVQQQILKRVYLTNPLPQP